MATRTTTTRTTSSARAPSADQTRGIHVECSFEELVAAYFSCRRSKRNTASALAFEQHLERNLAELHEALIDRRYRPGTSLCFVVTRPRPREVWAAAFRDPVVHHLLYGRIGTPIEASFIADSCACIAGRGTLYAARRLEAKVRSVTETWSQRAYYLKADVANFFVSIDKAILWRLLESRIAGDWWRWLAHTVLFHDPRGDVVMRGSPATFALVPPHKRLASQDANHGLPIGNLSSQFFANVYLDVLDRFVKHELRARHYVRYVDDFVLLHRSPRWLNEARAAIEVCLRERLALELNPRKTILQPVARGIDFVGQVVKPWRRLVRRGTYRSAMQRVAEASAEDLRDCANSYFGMLRQASRSHGDRAQLANLVRRRGCSVDMALTRMFERT